MKLSDLYKKLRKNNQREYRQFQACLLISIMLISSYIMMFQSPLVQNTLPLGGDSRTMAQMIFMIAVVGCTIFVCYASSLFLRYKSRETGVFLALGIAKGKLAKALGLEIGRILVKTSMIGLAAGMVLSGIIGFLFERIAHSGNDNHFAYTVSGAVLSGGYCVILFLCIFVMCYRFMKRSNVIDIINEQRKQEPFKKSVTTGYMISGILMIVIGFLIAYILPIVTVYVFQVWLGAWTNLFYLLILLGIYRLLVYSISVHRKGSNPQKYYNNMLAYGLMKFQGASAVKNMLVITLLIFGGLFGVFYVPLQSSVVGTYDIFPNDISYRFLNDSEEITEQEILKLGEKHGVSILQYETAEFIQLLGDSVDRSELDENGKLIEEYKEKEFYYECIGVTAYNEMTGDSAIVEEGQYLMIVPDSVYENIFFKLGDISKVYSNDVNNIYPITYSGYKKNDSLSLGNGFDVKTRLIISDSLYELLKKDIPVNRTVTQVLFDIEGGEQGLFSIELYELFCNKASESMNHMGYYDAYQAQLRGDDYGYLGDGTYDGSRPALETDWKYSPKIVPMMKEFALISKAIYLLLFIYIAIICLISESIIAYTRSRSIALSSKQTFEDLRKLGADSEYIEKLNTFQIKKVYFLPTLVGCMGILIFLLFILYFNDGRFTAGEFVIEMQAIICSVILGIYQYVLYRISKKDTLSLVTPSFTLTE